MSRSLRPIAVAGLVCFGWIAACSEPGSDGAVCAVDSDCLSALCYGSLCMAPDGDLDNDGLDNATEAALGTDPQSNDSDGDGLSDVQEVGSDAANPRDADGDYVAGTNLRHDANESALTDADGDCISDQFDRTDDQPETDLVQVASVSCFQLGVCGTPGSVVAASCDSGQVVCDYTAVAGWEAVEVTCDATDNDCDGAIDEGIVYATANGTLAPIGAPCVGVGVCEDDVGVVECGQAGMPVCSSSAGGSESLEGRVELPCNALDDDCDGETDGLVAYIGHDGVLVAVGEPCTSLGICQNQPGVVACVLETSDVVCSTGPGGAFDVSQPEACNGSDDDCDGFVDEELAYVPIHGGSELSVGEACGLAETPCDDMVVGCLDGSTACCLGTQPCVPWHEVAQAETCDEVDNDCDGLIDEASGVVEGCTEAEGVCATWDGVSGSCEEASGSTLVCDYSGVDGWEADETLCDSLDNDCDGLVDEDLMAGEGDDALPLGAACWGAGACAGETGVVSCIDDIAWCDAHENASPETCNGIDDDCDGAVDEDTDQLFDEVEDLQCLTAGVCSNAGASVACVGGQMACGYVAAPGYETNEASCDEQDNDCDGAIDEGTSKLFTGQLASSIEAQPVDRERWTLTPAGDGPLLLGGLHKRPLEEGGLSGRPLSDLWRLMPETGEWMPLASAPVPLADYAATWSSDLQALIVHGGFTVSVADSDTVSPEPQDTMWLWRSDTGTWHAVAQTVAGTAQAPGGRVEHSLTALGAGGLLMHGGRDLGSGEVQTWMGSLTVSEEGTDSAYACEWTVGPEQGAARHGHVGLLDVGRVVLAGGVASTTAGFATALDLDGETGWTPLGDLGKSQPPMRLGAAIALDAGNNLMVVGGRTVDTDDVASALLSDAWRYDPDANSWDSFGVPGDVPGLSGAFLVDHDSGLVLGGGDSGMPVSWRRSWTLDSEALTWAEKGPWAGLPPRTGGCVVVRPDTGQTWLIGGSRMPGGHPLMDAHAWNSDTGAWELRAEPLKPTPASSDLTRPGLEGASGLWNPVAQVGLLVGGRNVMTGVLSEAVWSFKPAEGDQAFTFEQVTTHGDIPSGVMRPVFAVDEASTAWLVGRFESGDDGQTTVRVYSLSLTGYNWTLEWAMQDASDLQDAVVVAGGPGPEGLDLFVIGADGGLAHWRYSPASATFSEQPLVGSVALTADLATWTYDPHSRLVLVTGMTPDGAASLVVDLANDDVETLTLDASWPVQLQGVATGVHPSHGALFVGGHDPGGYTTSSWHVAAQVCDDD